MKSYMVLHFQVDVGTKYGRPNNDFSSCDCLENILDQIESRFAVAPSCDFLFALKANCTGYSQAALACSVYSLAKPFWISEYLRNPYALVGFYSILFFIFLLFLSNSIFASFHSDDLRRWFIAQELDLFRYRFLNEGYDSIQQFLKENKFPYSLVRPIMFWFLNPKNCSFSVFSSFVFVSFHTRIAQMSSL